MKTVLLNLPYPMRIVRRYSCTYYAPNFLFPPLELMYLGAIIKQWKKDDCILIDAIAEKLNLTKVIKKLKEYRPDLLIFMAGIESFTEDVRMIKIIKSYFTESKIACIGYLPSLFPEDTLQHHPFIDYIIMNEPELTFSELYDNLRYTKNINAIAGLAARNNGSIFIGVQRERIRDLNILPFPAYNLINNRLYGELMMPKPFTVIQTSRGCPFGCIYCIRTYGRDITYRSIENVLSEIEEAILKYRVKTIRFMDDTFTLNRERVIKLCQLILKKHLKFQWTALSRVDTLDKEMLILMKSAGLRRVYLGIETGSQRLLDYYRKGYQADCIIPNVKTIKKAGIEIAAFFMVGGIQTEEEFKKDVVLAKKLNLDYIDVEKITPYPGTPLFEKMKDMVSEEKAIEWEKIFYKDFYFRSKFIINKLKDFIFHIDETAAGGWSLLKYFIYRQPHFNSRSDLI